MMDAGNVHDDKEPLRSQGGSIPWRRVALLLAGVLAIAAGAMATSRLSRTEGTSFLTARVAPAPDDVMRQRAFGTCEAPVEAPLRWGSRESTANEICCHNRRYAEFFGYWQYTSFPMSEPESTPITFYDSVTRRPLFVAPRGRSYQEFIAESTAHGWPSFRDEEVVWENVVVLPDGETVSINGTHLGHNLPDSRNRYCINIVCVAAVVG